MSASTRTWMMLILPRAVQIPPTKSRKPCGQPGPPARCRMGVPQGTIPCTCTAQRGSLHCRAGFTKLCAHLLGVHGLNSSRHDIPRLEAPQTISLFNSSSRHSRHSSAGRFSCCCPRLCGAGGGGRLGCCRCSRLGLLLGDQRQLEAFVGRVVGQHAALDHCSARGGVV